MSFTEAELEGRTGRDFDATTPITSTIVTQMVSDMDALVDQVDKDNSASSADKKQAALAAAAETVDKVYVGEEVDQDALIEIIQKILFDEERRKIYSFSHTSPSGDGYYE